MKKFLKIFAKPFIWTWTLFLAIIIFIVYISITGIASLVSFCEDLFNYEKKHKRNVR